MPLNDSSSSSSSKASIYSEVRAEVEAKYKNLIERATIGIKERNEKVDQYANMNTLLCKGIKVS